MLRGYLYFSKSDRRSIVVLAMLAVVCVSTLLIMKSNGQDGNTVEESMPVAQSDSTQQPKDIILMTEFDPNTVDSATLAGFGLTSSQVRTFLRYRKAGAVFRTPESLARVYGLTDSDLERITPYARIGEKYKERRRQTYEEQTNQPKRTDRQPSANASNKQDTATTHPAWRQYPEKFKQLTVIDPNTADTTTLQRIPGIGRWISKGIVEQRNRLGGFHSVEQLMEVKHFPEEALEWFAIDRSSVSVKKININEASFRELNSHPYISYEQTKDLLNFIRLYGKFTDMQSLLRTGIFTEEEMNRLQPYIELK